MARRIPEEEERLAQRRIAVPTEPPWVVDERAPGRRVATDLRGGRSALRRCHAPPRMATSGSRGERIPAATAGARSYDANTERSLGVSVNVQAAPVLCRATLNYFPSSAPAAPSAVDVSIRDGRAASLPGWEECGFELVSHESAVEDWADDEAIRNVHYDEIRQLATWMTGCDAAIVSNHIKRNPDKAKEHGDLNPITLVHSDFADSYEGIMRRRYSAVGEDEAFALDAVGITPKQAAAARRLVILQFWRNVGPAKMDMPIAFCDARTVPRSEIRPFPVTNYAGSGFNFDALGVAAPRDPDEHAWYAFDRLERDEAVAFRTFDSDRVHTDQPYWTPHSAFRDPDVPLGQPSRSSIELRASCLFL